MNFTQPATDAILAVQDSQARVLLRFKIDDGRLVAEYDPADLDEAARVFVTTVLRIADEGVVRGWTE